MSALKLAVAALLGAAAAYLWIKRPPLPALRLPDGVRLRECFGGFAGQFASPGLGA